MPNTNDMGARAQAALEKIADRLPDLPKPVLAALGAADLAGRQLSDLVGRLADRTGGKATTVPSRDEVVDELRSTATDLPARIQQLTADLPDKVQEMVADLPSRAKGLADQLEEFATRIPGRVQKFTEELPGRVSEMGEQLQPDQIRQSADAYRQLIASVFSTLADRGEKTWADIRNTGPVPGSVVDAAAESDTPRKVAAKVTAEKAGSTTPPEPADPAGQAQTGQPADSAAAGAPTTGAPTAGAPTAGAPTMAGVGGAAAAPAGSPAAEHPGTTASSTRRPPRRKPAPSTATETTPAGGADADSKPATAAGTVRPTAVSGQPPTPRSGGTRPS